MWVLWGVLRIAESTVQRGNRRYIGGVPPKSLYKWVDALKNAPAPAGVQRPSFYTGEAVCRGFGSLKVALVKKDSSYKCDRGCTFDL